jgi:hypothetical protein
VITALAQVQQVVKDEHAVGAVAVALSRIPHDMCLQVAAGDAYMSHD